jgi:hypothetical protein
MVFLNFVSALARLGSFGFFVSALCVGKKPNVPNVWLVLACLQRANISRVTDISHLCEANLRDFLLI